MNSSTELGQRRLRPAPIDDLERESIGALRERETVGMAGSGAVLDREREILAVAAYAEGGVGRIPTIPLAKTQPQFGQHKNHLRNALDHEEHDQQKRECRRR